MTVVKGWTKLSVRKTTRIRVDRIRQLMVRNGCGKPIEEITIDEAISWALDKLNGVGIHV